MLFELLFVLTVCILNWTTVQGCSCAGFPHLQDIFCSAAFVIKVNVTDVDHEGPFGPDNIPFGGGENVYSYNLLEEYKTSQAYNNAEKKLYTADAGATCGVFLRVGETYVLSGSVFQGKLTLGLCSSFKVLSSKLSKLLKKALKKKFKKNCDSNNPCSTCSFACKNPSSKNVCNIPRHFGSGCYYLHTYCRRKKGICRFKVSGQFNGCLAVA